MSNDFVLKIFPASGDDLRFLLSVTNPPLELKRAGTRLSLLTQAELEIFRSGNAPENVVRRVREEISKWLMYEGLTVNLLRAFQNQAELPVRLIIDVDDELRSDLADLPFELVEFQSSTFLLMNEVNSIVHLLQKVSSVQPSLSTRRPPLRVLLVRTSPNDFNVRVPLAAPLLEEIKHLVPTEFPDLITVDVLSSEEPGQPQVTWEAFKEKLAEAKASGTEYDLLVYLGHGDLLKPAGEDTATGSLLFEHPDGESSDPIRAEKLRIILQAHPISTVLLCGCLTGAAFEALDEEQRASVLRRLPDRMRGVQSVAQSLVRESGVQLAVGMRWRLELNDATAFIKAFFASLLKGQPGDVEIAVRAGRQALADINPFPPSWSAPVIYRTRGAEPMFPFLANPQHAPSTHPAQPDGGGGPPAPSAADPEELLKDNFELERREKAWSALAQIPNLQLGLDVRAEAEESLKTRMHARGASLLMPDFTLTKPETAFNIPVQLFSALPAATLKLQFVIGGADVVVTSVEASAALGPAGYELINVSGIGSNSVTFTIRAAQGSAGLPQGDIAVVRGSTGKSIAVVFPVSLNVVEVEPATSLLKVIGNALIVCVPTA